MHGLIIRKISLTTRTSERLTPSIPPEKNSFHSSRTLVTHEKRTHEKRRRMERRGIHTQLCLKIIPPNPTQKQHHPFEATNSPLTHYLSNETTTQHSPPHPKIQSSLSSQSHNPTKILAVHRSSTVSSVPALIFVSTSAASCPAISSLPPTTVKGAASLRPPGWFTVCGSCAVGVGCLFSCSDVIVLIWGAGCFV